jgi:hypothetical protein
VLDDELLGEIKHCNISRPGNHGSIVTLLKRFTVDIKVLCVPNLPPLNIQVNCSRDLDTARTRLVTHSPADLSRYVMNRGLDGLWSSPLPRLRFIGKREKQVLPQRKELEYL